MCWDCRSLGVLGLQESRCVGTAGVKVCWDCRSVGSVLGLQECRQCVGT